MRPAPDWIGASDEENVIPVKTGIHFSPVIPAKAGIQVIFFMFGINFI